MWNPKLLKCIVNYVFELPSYTQPAFTCWKLTTIKILGLGVKWQRYYINAGHFFNFEQVIVRWDKTFKNSNLCFLYCKLQSSLFPELFVVFFFMLNEFTDFWSLQNLLHWTKFYHNGKVYSHVCLKGKSSSVIRQKGES